MKVILVRHGETDWNRDSRLIGLSDIELNERGRHQAQELALALKEEPIEAIYSSPLKRALETAQTIARFHGLSVIAEDGLREMDAGEFDGLTIQEMREKYGAFLIDWLRDAASMRMPGGECLIEVQQRAWEAVQGMVARHSDGDVVVVSHNFVILTVICKALGLELSQFRHLRHGLAAMSILDLGERGVALTRLNDTCHLRRR